MTRQAPQAPQQASQAPQQTPQAPQPAPQSTQQTPQQPSRRPPRRGAPPGPRTESARRPTAQAPLLPLTQLRRLFRPAVPAARWIVPAAVLAGAAAGGAYGLLLTPEYAATSYVVVVPTEKSEPTAALGFATAYGRVASQVAVVGDAAVWAGVSARTLKENVQTATSPDAPMISVTATSSDAATAVNMADGVARSLVLNGGHLQASTHVRVLQFSRAVPPTSPVTPSAPLAALVGGCAGGLLGGLGLLVRPKHRPGAPAHAAAPVVSPQPRSETV
ncbi:lipopolysaccharide biosynthesis protein [Streptomyces sp. NPDC088124]|uniref:lipopolysaccharide biosynthesis protein n=1 Tax=Streptomyces sp. NPDC088124 TaxID=3154654 RepID=UPI00343E203E